MLTTIPGEASTTSPAAKELSPRRPKRHPTALLTAARNRVRKVWQGLAERLAAARADQSGNVITDNLAWIVFGVVIIVAIASLIKVLDSEVFDYVTNQLGV